MGSEIRNSPKKLDAHLLKSILTPWFPPRHGGAFSTLNLDCESSRRDRDKRLKSKSRAYDFTSPPVHATFQILKTYS